MTSFNWQFERDVRELESLRMRWAQADLDAGLATEAIERGWSKPSESLQQEIDAQRRLANAVGAELGARVRHWRTINPAVIHEWCAAHRALCHALIAKTDAHGPHDGPMRLVGLKDVLKAVDQLESGETDRFQIWGTYLNDYSAEFGKL